MAVNANCTNWAVDWTKDYHHNYTRPTICDMRHVQHWTWSNWFGYYSPILVPIVEQCFANLHADPVCWATPQLDADMTPGCPGAYNMISCVQSYLPSQVQLAMAGAQVILGLAPALISSLSPSVGEISMLAANRPILSLCLVTASPSLWSPRFLAYEDPLEVLKPQKNTPFYQFRRYRMGKREKWISFGQYVIAILAMFATCGISWQLGYYSVSSWKVGCPELIFIWSTLVFVPHLCASISWYWSKTITSARQANRMERNEENAQHGWLKASFIRETTICAAKNRRDYINHRPRQSSQAFATRVMSADSNLTRFPTASSDSHNNTKREHWWVVWANIVAGWMGWIQVVYGTCVFSSLLFIGPLNAFGCILSYVGSTLFCRAVITFELQGMRAVENDSPHEVVQMLSRQYELLDPKTGPQSPSDLHIKGMTSWRTMTSSTMESGV